MTEGVERTQALDLWIALLHHPVLNREREVITTAITNLDVHDIARAARTYNVKAYYVVTPIERQRELAQRIVEHWCQGHGATRVPERGEALKLVKTATSLDEVVTALTEETNQRPQVVATCARPGRSTITSADLKKFMDDGVPLLILLGTGWGLADTVFEQSDHVLEPINSPGGDYNHLSVRTAAAITLDRLLNSRC